MVCLIPILKSVFENIKNYCFSIFLKIFLLPEFNIFYILRVSHNNKNGNQKHFSNILSKNIVK